LPITHSAQPRKQRKARYNAPLHAGRKLISSHLDGDLILKYNRRSLVLIEGDTVKVLRGAHKGHTGKVSDVDLSRRRVVVDGVTNLKADGTKVPRSVDPSNLIITKPNLADPHRREFLLAGVKGSAEDKKKTAAEMEKEGAADQKALEEARQKEAEEREKARAEREAAEAAEAEHDHEHDHDHDHDHDHEHDHEHDHDHEHEDAAAETEEPKKEEEK